MFQNNKRKAKIDPLALCDFNTVKTEYTPDSKLK